MVLSIQKIKNEWVYFLRNSDVFSISQRNVSTTTATGTFSSATSYSIPVTNIKNIRSITVDSTSLSYITDYIYDIDFLDTTIKTKITFTTAQTGAYVITYDYGTDKIYPDFPRSDLTISSFPRMGFDIINIASNVGGFGGVNLNKVSLGTIIYAPKTEDLQAYIDSLRLAIFNAKLSFNYLGKYVRIVTTGPIITSERETGKDKIFQQNIDVVGDFNIES